MEKITEEINYHNKRDLPQIGKILISEDGKKWKVVKNETKSVSTVELMSE